MAHLCTYLYWTKIDLFVFISRIGILKCVGQWNDGECVIGGNDPPTSGIMSYIIDQRKLLFLKKIRTSDNTVLRSFSIMCVHEYGKILSKYSIYNLWSNSDDLKSSLWRRFVDTTIF